MDTDSAAGSLADWFDQMADAMRDGTETDVPCETCMACCESSLFVRVEQDEAALDHIPQDLLAPAPGQPGVFVLGYDTEGRCPMLGADGCTIYAHRPGGCRVFDCRIFAATDIAPEATHVALRTRSQQWTFELNSDRDQAVWAALDHAAELDAEGIAGALRTFDAAAHAFRSGH